MLNSFSKILITTGDTDGIGLEVTVKGLLQAQISLNNAYIVFISPEQQTNDECSLIASKFNIDYIFQIDQVKKGGIYFLISNEGPAHWVQTAALWCHHKMAQALVTGPLSKTQIALEGLSDIGHTDILKRVTLTKHVWMYFIGEYFHVLLLTGHIPISEVQSQLTLPMAQEALKSLSAFLKKNFTNFDVFGLVGLNPHAGDQGVISLWDQEFSMDFILWANSELGLNVLGPLVPDVAFQKQNWAKHPIYLAAYHDQGLIPFKLVHSYSGVHMSLGLPFIRTSVDHGTAKDIFGQDKADPTSMKQALELATQLLN